jgi:hypothetical protein
MMALKLKKSSDDDYDDITTIMWKLEELSFSVVFLLVIDEGTTVLPGFAALIGMVSANHLCSITSY